MCYVVSTQTGEAFIYHTSGERGSGSLTDKGFGLLQQDVRVFFSNLVEFSFSENNNCNAHI